MGLERFEGYASLKSHLADPDHTDVKQIVSGGGLRDFVADMFTYQPCWMRWLWAVRSGFARLLGLPSEAIDKKAVTGETLPIEPGKPFLFLTVCESDGETFWLAERHDPHLNFAVGVTADPMEGGNSSEYQVLTAVNYNNAVGRLYFNLIRPFHHLVVSASMRHAAASGVGKM